MNIRELGTSYLEFVGLVERVTQSPRKRTRANTTLRRTSLLISCCLSAVTLAGVSYAGEEIVPSADARPMTGVELYLLYRNKTWTWSDGAGRF
ncbi:MAG: DUF995 domain-containing protein, partial [Phyllobacterium sp.]|uniref:DUF995 domain-containing protein n=1 Tax=Phyllobacterium sp. TaxID=1871046 RepID=UPI0030F2EFDB